MRDRALAVVAELAADPPPLDPAEVSRGRASSSAGSPTTTSPSSATGSTASRRTARTWPCARSPAPASASCAPTRTCRSPSASCPPLVQAKAREKTLLVLAKANSRATVHRPAYLDYVGVKTFDAQGEVVGEQRFLGLFSSAAYTESVTRIPLLREKVRTVMHAGRLRPAQPRRQGADGHPRELPARRAVPHLGRRARPDRAGRDVRPRASPAAALRPPRHLRPLRLRARLPAPRPLQHHRPRAVLGDPQGPPRRRQRRVHRPRQRVDHRPRPLRRPPAQGRDRRPTSTSPTSSAGWSRPSRSWRDDFIAAVVDRVRRGARLAPGPPLGRLPSRRPTRRTSTPARPPPTSAGSRPSRATRASTSRSSSRSTPAAARPGSRCSASGRRCR